jgi:hypothetical protein
VWPAVASESCASFEERSGSRLIEMDFMGLWLKGGTYANAAQVKIVF